MIHPLDVALPTLTLTPVPTPTTTPTTTSKTPTTVTDTIDTRVSWTPTDAPGTTRYAVSNIEQTVVQWYRTVLGRDPDTEGFATWVRNILNMGQVSAYGQFYSSPEAAAHRAAANATQTTAPTPTTTVSGGATDSTGGGTATGTSVGDLLNSLFGAQSTATPPVTAAPSLQPVTVAASSTPWLTIAIVAALAVGAWYWYKHSHTGA